jgi:hypothetical protein
MSQTNLKGDSGLMMGILWESMTRHSNYGTIRHPWNFLRIRVSNFSRLDRLRVSSVDLYA